MTHRTAPPERAPVVGPAPPPSPPGASGDHFAAILDKHQARTATAEGHNDKPAARDEKRAEPNDAARGREATPQGTASRTEANDGAKKAEGKDAPAAPAAVPVAVAPESTVDSRQSTVAE